MHGMNLVKMPVVSYSKFTPSYAHHHSTGRTSTVAGGTARDGTSTWVQSGPQTRWYPRTASGCCFGIRND